MSTERTALPVVESTGSCCGGSPAAEPTEAAAASCCSTDARVDDPTT